MGRGGGGESPFMRLTSFMNDSFAVSKNVLSFFVTPSGDWTVHIKGIISVLKLIEKVTSSLVRSVQHKTLPKG